MSAALDTFLPPRERAERALLAAGLVRGPDGVLALAGGAGVTLRALEPSGGWCRFVSSPREAGRGAARALQGTAPAPAGPFKLLPGPVEGSVVIAADFPLFLDGIEAPPTGGPGELLDASAASMVAWTAAWAMALVEELGDGAGASRGDERDPPPIDVARLVEQVRALGWDASSSDGVVAVNLPASRSFHQARFLRDGGRGVLIEAELAAVEDPGESWCAAALEVAREADERLRLARVAVRRGAAGGSIAAQVHLGRLPLASPWLPVGLIAVGTAVSLLAREARALADPVVAELVVSSHVSRTASANGGGKEVS